MAKQIVTWCDKHLTDHQEEVSGQSARIHLDELSRPLVVDLCDVCYKELVGPLAAFLADHGQPADDTSGAANERTYECPVVGCGKVYKRNESLKKHVASVHEQPGLLDPPADTAAPVKKSTEKKRRVKTGTFPCSVCERVFDSKQGASLHYRRVHGDMTGNPQERASDD